MKLALIACGGSLPQHIYKACLKQGTKPLVISFKEKPCLLQADFTISLGQIGKLFRLLKQNSITHLVLCGALDRPILSHLRFDFTGLITIIKLIPYFKKGDNALLSKIITFFEKKGFSVPKVKDYASGLLSPEGCLTEKKPNPQEFLDAEKGLKLLHHLSPFDIGQACIIDKGLVLAIETLEGTDAMLAKLTDFPLHKRPKPLSGVLIKAAKTTQELRIDLPTIGLETVKNAQNTKLSGIFYESEKSFLLDKEEAIAYCNQHNLFLCGISQK